MPPRHALLRLCLAGGRLGPRRRRLETHGGNAEAVLAMGPTAWHEACLTAAQIHGVQGLDPATDAVETRALSWMDAPCLLYTSRCV